MPQRSCKHLCGVRNRMRPAHPDAAHLDSRAEPRDVVGVLGIFQVLQNKLVDQSTSTCRLSGPMEIETHVPPFPSYC